MLSVLITAYNQDELTLAHIREAMNSDLCPDEIVVVNDGGKDFKIDLPTKCPIVYARILEDKTWNQNGARNLALYLSRGDNVVVEDNDHMPNRDFYKQAVELLKENDRVACAKRWVISRNDLGKPQEEWTKLKTRGKADIIAAWKRNSLLDIKGFDEGFCGQYGWDVPDLSCRAEMLKIKTAYTEGYYVVGDWMCNEENREYYKGSWATKMAPDNYHRYKRHARENICQSELGILNFNYEVKRYA